ncbi:MAG: hypothetical protein SH857_00280 [Chitinophagales bacterium]|nr:hypothetical protein [Chitinophagales bacterium]
MLKNIREYENLHILLWLTKDTCWILDWQTASMVMIVPTIAAAIHIAWRWRNDASELMHSLAICFWIFANGIWMSGEFFFEDTLRPYAIPFFVLGLLSVAVHYLYLAPRRALQNRSKRTRE